MPLAFAFANHIFDIIFVTLALTYVDRNRLGAEMALEKKYLGGRKASVLNYLVFLGNL